MDEAKMSLSGKQRERLKIVDARAKKRIRAKEAAERLGRSTRTLRRLVREYQARGDVAVVHGLAGRKSNHRRSDKDRAKILQLHEKHYSDYGPTLLRERLENKHGMRVAIETVRQVLIGAGRWVVRRAKVEKHSWRERRARFGELLQFDTSIHDWLEGRGEKAVLVACIDDATGRAFGLFAAGDTVHANFATIRGWIERHGRPLELYCDRATHFFVPDAEGRDCAKTTQFGRAVQEELGIRMIAAKSPQAKGRVERLFRTLQDRLVKELREAGVRTLVGGNRFLETYWKTFNEEFAVEPRDSHDAHRPLETEMRRRLEEILCVRETRVLRSDMTFSHEDRVFLVESPVNRRLKPGASIEVLSDALGKRRFRFERRDIACRDVTAEARPRKATIRRPLAERVSRRSSSTKPAANHPWRALAIPRSHSPEARAPLGGRGVGAPTP